MTFKDRLTRAFSIDYRSLAAFRIALGVGLIAHAITFIPGMFDFFATGGIATWAPRFPSIFLVSTAKWYVALVFALEALCGIAIVYNVFPRVAAALAYWVFVSLSWRTPEVTYGVDMLMRMEFIWLFFLPLGRQPGESTTRFTSIASVGALGQITLVYVFTGLFKETEIWLNQGMSVYQALLGYTFTTSFGHSLSQMPLPLLKAASVGVLLLERLGPILFFSPFAFATCRLVAFVSLALMHLVFAMSLHIGLFAYADIVFLLLLLPGEFWDELASFRVLQQVWLPARRDVFEFLSPLAHSLAAIVFAVITLSNLHGYFDFSAFVSPQFTRFLNRAGLEQRWTMFAPYPSADAGIYIPTGLTQNNEIIDAFAADGSSPDFTFNSNWIHRLPNARWISFLRTRYHRAGLQKKVSDQFGDFFCGRWKKAHGESLKEVSLWLRYPILLAMPGNYGNRIELVKASCESTESKL